MSARLESLLMQLGHPGRYQIIVTFLLQLNVFWYLVTIFTLSMWNYTPSHRCKVIGDINTTDWLLGNKTQADDSPWSGSCHLYIDPTNHSFGKLPCDAGYEYGADAEMTSIAVEWDYVCDNRYALRVFQTLFLVGCVVGGVFGGALADKYGRKPMVLGTLYSSMALGAVSALAPHPYAFAATKLLQGGCVQACMASSTSLKIEFLPTKYRARAHAVGEVISATLCVLYIALAIYLTENWRYVEYFNLLPMVLTIGNIWLIPESLRWMLKTKKEDQAVALIQRIAKFNGIQLPDTFKSEIQGVVQDIEGESNHTGNASLKDLFRQKTLAIYTLVFMSNWISGTFLGMGVVLSLSNFSGTLIFKYLVMAAAVFIVKILFFIVAVRVGRRITVSIAFITAGLVTLISVLNSAVLNLAPVISTIAGSTARGCVSSLMSISFLYVAEVFPTELRTFAQGCCSGAGRIGSMLVPLALLIGDYTWDWLPFLIFGICGITAGIITRILPETRNRPMPNNVEDTLQMRKKKKKEEVANNGGVI